MSANATNYFEEKIINDMLRTGSKYLGLFTTAITEAGTGTEVSGGSYARQAVTLDAPSQVSDKATTQNSSQITFPQATAAWGIITHWALFDALTSGNMYLYGTLTSSKQVDSGDNIEFAAGDLKITVA